MKAVVIGAGRIGCGLVGQALRRSGHEVVFVARSRPLTDYLNRVGGYHLRLLTGRDALETTVEGVRAVCVADRERVVWEIAAADLVATCVQPHDLPGVAELIAAGLQRRSRPTNVLSFENRIDSGPALRQLVASHLPAGWPLDRYGFSGALAARVVSRQLGDPRKDATLTFVADRPTTFVVDRGSLRGPLPEIEGMIATKDYGAVVRHKLYVFSAGHAVAAYLGYLKGYRYIHTAIRDGEIRSAVVAAMTEGREGLGARYGSGAVGIESDPIKIVGRFDNAALGDAIIRVGRDPKRKLDPGDRLIGAAKLAEQAGVCPDNLALGVAAALCFESARDPSSVQLQRELARDGIYQVLPRLCRLDPRRGFGGSVAVLWRRLRNGGRSKNLLLSLDKLFWAWSSEEANLTATRNRVAG